METFHQDLLDNLLLGRDRILTSVTAPLYPYVVSKQMEQFVLQNFQMMKEFEKHLRALREQDEDRRSVKEVLLGRLDDILKKVVDSYICILQHTCFHAEPGKKKKAYMFSVCFPMDPISERFDHNESVASDPYAVYLI